MDSYSNFGPLPRQPSCMLRSYLLSIKLRITSITQWCSKLKECPLYAILSGFPVNDTPGIGTFYDFFSRLWASDSNNLSPKERHIKEKTKKGKNRGDKTPLGTKMTCENLLPFLVKQPIQNTHPFQLIFKLYHQQFLNVSVEKGLIDSKQLSVAGDGTLDRTSSLLRKKRICDCKEKGITNRKCKRRFSQPECNSGWDSSRECYFNGYHLFQLSFYKRISRCEFREVI